MMDDVTIIGGGPSGLAAATLLYKKNYKVSIIERNEELGGLLDQCIHDGFGTKLFNKALSGPEFAHRFLDQVKESNIEIHLNSYVKKVEIKKDKKTIHCITPDGIKKIETKSIIYAIGCRERNQYEILIGGSRPAGVETAGTIQRLVNLYGILPGNNVIIVGGGDVGMIVARHLKLEGVEKIFIIYPEEFFTGLPRNVQQCILDFDIPYQPQTIVKKVIGKEKIEAVELVKVDENWQPIPGTEKTHKCDSLILSVGLIPYAEKLEEIGAEIDCKTGGPVVNECFETTIKGVFAVGNLLQIFDYVDDAVETAFIAAEGVEQYLKNPEKNTKKEYTKIIPGDNINCLTPQRIEKCKNEIIVFFRPCITAKKPKIQIKNKNGKILQTFKKPFIRPSTLENIKIKKENIENEKEVKITIEQQ
jgi:thioredoxin reductase